MAYDCWLADDWDKSQMKRTITKEHVLCFNMYIANLWYRNKSTQLNDHFVSPYSLHVSRALVKKKKKKIGYQGNWWLENIAEILAWFQDFISVTVAEVGIIHSKTVNWNSVTVTEVGRIHSTTVS